MPRATAEQAEQLPTRAVQAQESDPQGLPVGASILELMSRRGSGGYDYRWKNPVTGQVEDKHALLRKTGHLLVAVGYYKKPQ